MVEKKPTVFQKYIVDKLREIIPEFGETIIERNKVRESLYRNRIPVKLHKQFLEELVDLGYIKLHNRKKIELLDSKEDQRDVEVL